MDIERCLLLLLIVVCFLFFKANIVKCLSWLKIITQVILGLQENVYQIIYLQWIDYLFLIDLLKEKKGLSK